MTLHAETSQTSQASSRSSGNSLAIETHGLSKHFGQRKAVDGLTISVPGGAITGFVGPNGAGKTTTIRMLLGLIRPSSGSATVLGQTISHPRAYLPRVGALIESPASFLSQPERAQKPGGAGPAWRSLPISYQPGAGNRRTERSWIRPGWEVLSGDEAAVGAGHGAPS